MDISQDLALGMLTTYAMIIPHADDEHRMVMVMKVSLITEAEFCTMFPSTVPTGC